MTKATLIRTTLNRGWLTGSEIQSIIIRVRAQSIQADIVLEEGGREGRRGRRGKGRWGKRKGKRGNETTCLRETVIRRVSNTK